MGKKVLDVKNLTIQYRTDLETVHAVNGISFSLEKGETLGLVGETGAGKTTTALGIMGLLPERTAVIPEGSIEFEGTDLLKLSEQEMQKVRGSQISMIFQDSGAMMNPTRKVGKVFTEYILTHEKISKKEAWSKGIAMLERMRLPSPDNIMESYPFQLSGGMRQRVGIAMGMTYQPKLLLADEPTSALDVTTQAQIVREMMELRDTFGTSIIIVTHNIGVAAYMADKMIVMKQGKVVDSGDREEILHNPKSDYTKNLLLAVPSLKGERYV